VNNCIELTPKQNEYRRCAVKTWNVKVGATRSGKTYGDYWLIPKRIREVRGLEGLYVILGNTKGTLQRNVIEPMQMIWGAELVGDIGADNTAQIFGEKVYCLGADNVKHVNRLRGASVKYCYGDEVVTWNPDVFSMLKSRLDKAYSRCDLTCNPEGPTHWFKRELDKAGEDWYIQTYTLDDNPKLDEAVKKRMKRDFSGTVFYQRYILGLWAASEGALFTTMPEYCNQTEKLRDGIAHVDAAYGGEDYTALTCAKRDGDTLYLYGRLWRKHVDTLMDALQSETERLMCAPIYCETNGDKGYLARELRRRNMAVRAYPEKMNKYLKISTYLKKWWGNIVFLEGTDRDYIAQIMDYTEDAEHDDAPDSAACCCRILDRSGASLYVGG
jgi:hypothetical protein